MKIEDMLHGRLYREEAGSGDEGAGGDDGPGPDGDTGDGGDGGDGGSADWRKDLAGDNQDYAKRLERYTDVGSFVESSMQAHDKLRAGETSSGLPDNATEEQLSAYREANHIPLDGKYELALEPGVDLTQQDDAIMSKVMEVAHLGNVPTDVFSAMTNAMYLGRNELMEQMQTQDGVDEQTFATQARENWGGDYESNMNRIDSQFNILPESARSNIMSARMADGKALTSSLEFMNWVAGMDRQINPMTPIPGGASTNNTTTAQQIIADSKERMRDDREGWGKDLAAQNRFKEAVRFMEKHEQK